MHRTLIEPVTLRIDTLPRPRLLETLRRRGVSLNQSAETLLGNAVFDHPEPRSVTVVERSISDLGLTDGAVLPTIFEAAQAIGLDLCPPTVGPYLRLALQSQPTAPDSIMSNGRAPSASLTVASAPLRGDDDYPKGFYLRVVDNRPWLRGYRCTDEYAWDAGDSFVFAAPSDPGP